MLLAIDVGNTQTVVGAREGGAWRAVWRRATRWDDTGDQVASWLRGMFELSGIEYKVDGVVIGSVVPPLDHALRAACSSWLGTEPVFVAACPELGLEVDYDPPHAVGADRLANALGALARWSPPLVVVDFGTATTFDVVSAKGAYVGGAILPGVQLSGQALFERTAKLPAIDYSAPSEAIGKNTVDSVRSGVMFGYAGAIEALVGRIRKELGGDPAVIATGGLGKLFLELCPSIGSYEPNLTLDGLAIAYDRLRR